MIFPLAFAVALAAATPAAAHSPPPNDQPIVIQGSRDQKRTAANYLNNILPPVWDARIGRFEEPLCPSTIGLPNKLKTQVLSRIRQVAAAADIPVNAGQCKPNLLIIVVDDKKALIEGMRRHKEAYLYGLGDDRVKRLENSPEPVAAWQVTDIIGADGMPLRRDGDGYPRLFTTMPPSRIVEMTKTRILGGIVVVEQRGLTGVTTRQLADYALVRLLTPIQSSQSVAPDSSILSLFNNSVHPADAPQSLTWWDLAFLKALFDTRSDTAADVQRHEIREKMLTVMAKIRQQ